MLSEFFFVLPILKYCPAVWCSVADTHIKLLDRVVSVVSFLTGGVLECDIAHRLTGGVLECDIAHRRSMAVLCMLYKIWCKPMHPHYDDLPVPYVQVPIAPSAPYIDILMGLLAAELRITAGPLLPDHCPCGTIMLTLYSMVWDWRVSRAGPMLFYLPCSTIQLCLLLFFPFSSFCP